MMSGCQSCYREGGVVLQDTYLRASLGTVCMMREVRSFYYHIVILGTICYTMGTRIVHIEDWLVYFSHALQNTILMVPKRRIRNTHAQADVLNSQVSIGTTTWPA